MKSSRSGTGTKGSTGEVEEIVAEGRLRTAGDEGVEACEACKYGGGGCGNAALAREGKSCFE